MESKLSRRSLLVGTAAVAGAIAGPRRLRSPARAALALPKCLLQAGDVTADSAMLWARAELPGAVAGDRPPNLTLELSTSPRFDRELRSLSLGTLTAEQDFIGKLDVTSLSPGTRYYYRVDQQASQPVDESLGQFQTAPAPDEAKTVRFAWLADLAGQGWGRNPEFQFTAFNGERLQGGYLVFEVLRKFKPDFAVFQGDMIYADVAIPTTQSIPEVVGGGTWRSEPGKDFVAITLDEFRANWKYNLADENLQRFLAETPIYVEWDDHEVTNNWYPGEILPEGAPYSGLSVDVLAQRATQALFEYNPIRGRELFRNVQHGQHLEVFIVDYRTFRDPNPNNSDPEGSQMLGQRQFEWLKQAVSQSRATWKVIASHDPLTIVTGGKGDRDAWGQGDPEILGREAQLRDLLQFFKQQNVKNVVSISADVHFAAAIHADPERAIFKDFNPFWEFVVGPIHSGAFGPSKLDPSFGPEYEFARGPATLGMPQNLPPIATDFQFFGLAEVDGQTADLTVQIRTITGQLVYEKVLRPEA